MSAMKVWADKVLMGFWWEDDAPTLAADARVAYYHAYYTQDPTTKPLLLLAEDLTIIEATDSFLAAWSLSRENVVGRAVFDVFSNKSGFNTRIS